MFTILQAQKVGLVLSGGGARGVTHIGVLKALEENNIPIDYISGTSMGAVVGGMYACGYTPDEIEEFLISENAIKWIKGESDEMDYHIYKNPEYNASWQLFKITYDSTLKIKLPTNAVSPYDLDYEFLDLYAGASAAANNNFDSLFIPFRCIASDIVENKALILKTGQVAQAIRASATFPFYFRPIRINDKLLFDGGMYNNFPVDVMEDEFAPDFIIGSKAASEYSSPDENDLVSQVQSMLMSNSESEIDPENGVLIEPHLKTINITDFSHTKAFIDSGYNATIEKIPDILKSIKRRQSQEQRNKLRNAFKDKIPTIEIRDLIYTGVTDKQKSFIDKLFKKKKLFGISNGSGHLKTTNLTDFKSNYFKLLIEEPVGFVYPRLLYDKPSGYYDLHLTVSKENELSAELGGLVSSEAITEVFFQMQYTYWRKNMLRISGNVYLGRFHNSGQLKARMDFPGTFPFFIESAYTSNKWNYFKTSTYFFGDESPAFLIQRDSYVKTIIGIPFTPVGYLGTDIIWGSKNDEYYQTNQFTRVDTADRTYFDFVSPGLYIEINTLNRKQFATKGMYLKGCFRLISGNETNIPGSTSSDKIETNYYHQWYQLRFRVDKYFLTKTRITFGILGEATLSNQAIFNNYTSTLLAAPAFEPIPESKTIFLQKYRAFNFAAAGAKMIFKIDDRIDLRTEAYIFQPIEEIIKTEDNKASYHQDLSKRYYILSGSIVFHAPFGPISLSTNYYTDADQPFSLNFSLGFFIFNKRPY